MLNTVGCTENKANESKKVLMKIKKEKQRDANEEAKNGTKS